MCEPTSRESTIAAVRAKQDKSTTILERAKTNEGTNQPERAGLVESAITLERASPPGENHSTCASHNNRAHHVR